MSLVFDSSRFISAMGPLAGWLVDCLSQGHRNRRSHDVADLPRRVDRNSVCRTGTQGKTSTHVCTWTTHPVRHPILMETRDSLVLRF